MITARTVFADASFYTALLNKRDAYHDRAIAWQRKIVSAGSQVLTTEAVLWEFLNGCSTIAARSVALQAYYRLHADSRVQVIGYEASLCTAAFQLYGSRLDKEWGITDCLSFVAMRLYGATDALTADRHFQQAGFAALLLQDP